MFSLTKLPVPIDPFMEQRLKLRIFVHEPFSEKRFLVLVDPLENIAHLHRKIERVYMANYCVNDVKVKAVSLQGYFINKNSIIKEALRDCDLITCDLSNYPRLEKVKLEPQNKLDILNENDENMDSLDIPKKKVKLNFNTELLKDKLNDKKINTCMMVEADLIQKLAKTIFSQNNLNEAGKTDNKTKKDDKLENNSKLKKNSPQKPFDLTFKSSIKTTEKTSKTQNSETSNKKPLINAKKPETSEKTDLSGKLAEKLNGKLEKSEKLNKAKKPEDTEKNGGSVRTEYQTEKLLKTPEQPEKTNKPNEKQTAKSEKSIQPSSEIEPLNETFENQPNNSDMALQSIEPQSEKPEKPEISQTASPKKDLRSKKISKPSPTQVKTRKGNDKKSEEEKGKNGSVGIYEAAYKKIMSKKNDGKEEDEKKEKKVGELIVIVEENAKNDKVSEEKVSPQVLGLNYKLKKHLAILEDL